MGLPAKRPLHVVRPVTFVGDDEALVAGIKAESPPAVDALIERYSPHVVSVLARILGASDPDVPDLCHDTLFRALRSAKQIADPSALKGWLTIIAVNVARSALKRRARARWLTLLPWYELPEVEAPAPEDHDRDALRTTYALLGELSADDRIALALRYIDGMELTEVAAAMGISLATVKRRLQRAEAGFLERAREAPELRGWLEGGSRWGRR
jgi:RNA polymerase sigma-70 factor, ECF subfamily